MKQYIDLYIEDLEKKIKMKKVEQEVIEELLIKIEFIASLSFLHSNSFLDNCSFNENNSSESENILEKVSRLTGRVVSQISGRTSFLVILLLHIGHSFCALMD